MSNPSRRALIAGAMVFGATAAAAQDNRSLTPIVGNKGGAILGPHNDAIAGQNKDFLHPPTTDHGAITNLRYKPPDQSRFMSRV
jgi:hypothetical protein